MNRTSDYFAQVERHKRVGEHILAHSENPLNIYTVAADLLTLSEPVKVLDLGCGYGKFTKALLPILLEGSVCHGLDCRTNFSDPFLQTIQSGGFSGEFMAMEAEDLVQLPEDSYDLVAAAYSLYFFPQLIGEIKRILKPQGQLLAITHSYHGLQEFFNDLRVVLDEISGNHVQLFDIERKVNAFCAENGLEYLRPHFETVQMSWYPNRLVFDSHGVDDLIYYLEFRLDVMCEEEFLGSDVQLQQLKEIFLDHIRERIEEEGRYTLNKDDAILLGANRRQA